jgi:polar amino acid transport system substrate-binding protein
VPSATALVRAMVAIAAMCVAATPAGASAASPSAAPSAALGADLLDDIGVEVAGDLNTPGRLVICTSFPRTRFAEFDAQARPFGVDVEIGQGIAIAMGLEADVLDILFEDLIGALEDRRCDAIIAGHFITSARLERMEMIAYRQGTPNVIVRTGDPLALGELRDLCGRTFAVVAGTVYVDLVRGLGDYADRGVNNGCREAGKPEVELREYPTEPEAEYALATRNADAYAGNEAITVDQPDVFQLGPELEHIRNGIGTRKGAQALHTAVRGALGAMIEDGSYLAILDRYGVAGAAVTSAP